MDGINRALLLARSQRLFGLQQELGKPARPRPDERVDIPEIQESTRVSFSGGAVVQRSLATRTGVALYNDVQQL
jgi:hypothetical protein